MNMDISSVADLIFVNFQWSILQKVATFDSVEKEDQGGCYIIVKKGGSVIRKIIYDDIHERDDDYRKVNDVLMSVRNAVIGNITGKQRDGKTNTKTQKTGSRQTKY